MRSKRIWTTNFVVTASLAILIIGKSLGGIGESDKDIIAIYFAIFVALYLMILASLFYRKIYKWTQNRNLFYITSFIATFSSFIILYNSIISSIPFWTTLLGMSCLLNVLTFALAMLTNEKSDG
jgi:hypothetical protein